MPRRARLTGTVAFLLWMVLVLAATVGNLVIAVAATNPSATRLILGQTDLAGADAIASG